MGLHGRARLHHVPSPFMIAEMEFGRLTIAAAGLSAGYMLLHAAMLVHPQWAEGDGVAALMTHAALGIAGAIVFLRFRTPAILGSFCFISMAMAASALLSGPDGTEIGMMRAARALIATSLGLLALLIAANSVRRARFTRGAGRPRPDGRLAAAAGAPFRIDPNSEPQRLLALASLRRRLIAQLLGLTGPEAAAAAYSLELRLREKLAQLEADSPARHQIAAGLVVTGDASALDLLIATLGDPVEPLTLEALTLVTGLPGKCTHPAEIARWISKRRRQWVWDPAGERYRG